MVDLTIAMCSTDTRFDGFALRMHKQLFDQWRELSAADQKRVQILSVTDNKVMTIGAKRNWLVRMASGRYVVFVDDDDRIGGEYVKRVLKATEQDCDAICFPAMVSLSGGNPRICYYSKDFHTDHNTPTGYQRRPNHICAVKRVLMMETPFADICMGEDADYACRLLPKLHSEVQIETPLYFYDYDPRTSECRR